MRETLEKVSARRPRQHHPRARAQVRPRLRPARTRSPGRGPAVRSSRRTPHRLRHPAAGRRDARRPRRTNPGPRDRAPSAGSCSPPGAIRTEFQHVLADHPSAAFDLPSDLLHFAYPDRYWLWARWMWNPRTETGALALVTDEEFDFGDDDPGLAYMRIGEAVAFVGETGRAAGLATLDSGPFGIDVFLGCVYAIYMYTVLRMRMTQEFNRIVPPTTGTGQPAARRATTWRSDRADRGKETGARLSRVRHRHRPFDPVGPTLGTNRSLESNVRATSDLRLRHRRVRRAGRPRRR